MCQPYIESATALSDKNFRVLSGCGKALQGLSWTQKCECRLESSVLVSYR